jgi:hypothetical protein
MSTADVAEARFDAIPGQGLGPLPAHLRRVRDLVAFADRIPEHRVMSAISEYGRRLGDLPAEGVENQRARYLVVIGALVNRAMFELLQLPRDANHVL